MFFLEMIPHHELSPELAIVLPIPLNAISTLVGLDKNEARTVAFTTNINKVFGADLKDSWQYSSDGG